MAKFPKEIENIYSFLKNCKYENISDNKYIYYKSPSQIDKTNSCVCFDGAMYAYSKLQQLGYKPQIFTIKGIRKENGKLTNVAHSLCIIKIDGKYGGIGKSGSEQMQYKEPIYSDLKQLAISFTKDLFNRNIWAQSYFIEDETNFPLLLTETSDKLYTQNQICKQTSANYLEIKEITQYLNQIWNISNEIIQNFLTELRKR